MTDAAAAAVADTARVPVADAGINPWEVLGDSGFGAPISEPSDRDLYEVVTGISPTLCIRDVLIG